MLHLERPLCMTFALAASMLSGVAKAQDSSTATPAIPTEFASNAKTLGNHSHLHIDRLTAPTTGKSGLLTTQKYYDLDSAGQADTNRLLYARTVATILPLGRVGARATDIAVAQYFTNFRPNDSRQNSLDTAAFLCVNGMSAVKQYGAGAYDAFKQYRAAAWVALSAEILRKPAPIMIRPESGAYKKSHRR